jgi:hypothetical protein
MLEGQRVHDTEYAVFERTRSGRVRARPDHQRPDACDLVRTFRLGAPAFGGTSRTALRASYRLTRAADVTVTVTRGRRVVKRFVHGDRAAGATQRITLRAAGLARGDYRVRLQAVSGDEQISATLVARRL